MHSESSDKDEELLTEFYEEEEEKKEKILKQENSQTYNMDEEKRHIHPDVEEYNNSLNKDRTKLIKSISELNERLENYIWMTKNLEEFKDKESYIRSPKDICYKIAFKVQETLGLISLISNTIEINNHLALHSLLASIEENLDDIENNITNYSKNNNSLNPVLKQKKTKRQTTHKTN